jgi:hypothetical protein
MLCVGVGVVGIFITDLYTELGERLAFFLSFDRIKMRPPF